ncbi:DinB family protein [Pedobacter aquatilis]|uniref:DinB family protein n=1 Tax=Pedobacter aquatilis TaxID=351343 RepID=UPI00292E6736|nr:DinB family protein [Pedobacter aquatilis]
MLKQQYEFVLMSRNTMMEYVETISEEDFLRENSSFGRGSIRNLLVHICDTYASWIGERALKKEISYKPFNAYQNFNDCRAYFEIIDNYISEFLSKFSADYISALSISRNEKIIGLSPLKLFTHVITQEFHHKGQIMTLSRHLGYIPVDADIIR